MLFGKLRHKYDEPLKPSLTASRRPRAPDSLGMPMSLTITDITEYGIVMVADTALSEILPDTSYNAAFGFRERALFGARKLFGHPNARAGLATWGAGTLTGSVATQFFIEKFLEDHAAVDTVEGLAEDLRVVLNAFYGAGPAALGVHLAGMVNDGITVCYEIRNADPPYNGKTRDFDVVTLKAPGPVTADARYLVAGGDLRLFDPLTEAIEAALAAVRVSGLKIPADSLEARRDFFAAHVRFVSDLYASARKLRSIGGEVTALKITNDRFLHMP